MELSKPAIPCERIGAGAASSTTSKSRLTQQFTVRYVEEEEPTGTAAPQGQTMPRYELLRDRMVSTER